MAKADGAEKGREGRRKMKEVEKGTGGVLKLS